MPESNYTHTLCLLSILLSLLLPVLAKSRWCHDFLKAVGWWWAGLEFWWEGGGKC